MVSLCLGIFVNTVITKNDEEILNNIGSLEIATRGRRLAGYCITKLVFVLVVLSAVLIAELTNINGSLVVISLSVFSILLHVFLLVNKQQTLGMMLLKTKIVSDGTSKFSIKRVIVWRLSLNWVLPFIPAVNLLSFFNYVNITGNATNRCIHDELSKTVVVKQT